MEPQKHKFAWLRSIGSWMHRHRTVSLAIGGAIIVLVAGITAAVLLAQEPEAAPKPATSAKPKPKPIYYAPLTGEIVKTEAAITKPVTAIMIENSPDARPQSGIRDAEIVYEAVAEGGITRFLAFYQQKKPQLIGPVRSLRMYYVDWLTPYNASVAHIGGSHKALQTVRGGKYRDIDQFFNAGTYWRASDRYAPHNVYTSFARLDALNKAKGYKVSNPKTFEREKKETTTAAKLNAKSINLHISGPVYDSAYGYEAKSKLYVRSQAGAPHLDREKGRITARVVIAMMVDMKRVLEDGYRESITTTGKGTAYIFQNGRVNQVVWHKDSRDDQISFTKGGKVVPLAAGTTWITAIPKTSGSVTWK